MWGVFGGFRLFVRVEKAGEERSIEAAKKWEMVVNATYAN